jgi:hypothetical protein
MNPEFRESVRLTISADVTRWYRSASFIRNYSVEQKLTKKTKRWRPDWEMGFEVQPSSPNGGLKNRCLSGKKPSLASFPSVRRLFRLNSYRFMLQRRLTNWFSISFRLPVRLSDLHHKCRAPVVQRESAKARPKRTEDGS